MRVAETDGSICLNGEDFPELLVAAAAGDRYTSELRPRRRRNEGLAKITSAVRLGVLNVNNRNKELIFILPLVQQFLFSTGNRQPLCNIILTRSLLSTNAYTQCNVMVYKSLNDPPELTYKSL